MSKRFKFQPQKYHTQVLSWASFLNLGVFLQLKLERPKIGPIPPRAMPKHYKDEDGILEEVTSWNYKMKL